MEKLRELTVGYLSTFYHTSHFLAVEDFSNYGFKLKWRLFGTGPAIVEAFQRNELDIAYIGVPPALVGMDRGVDIVCIAGGHVEGTTVAAKGPFKGYPELKELKDLFVQFRGFSIGVPGKGSIHDVILRRFVKEYSLIDDIEIINFQWADEIVESFRKGQLSIAVGTPALGVCLEHFTGASILWPPSKLWPNNPSYAIFAKRQLLSNLRHELKIFLNKHEEVTQFLRNNPEEASERLSKIIGPIVEKRIILQTLTLSSKYCAKISRQYIQATMEFVDAMIALGYINKAFSADEIFDTSIVDEIHPEQAHY